MKKELGKPVDFIFSLVVKHETTKKKIFLFPVESSGTIIFRAKIALKRFAGRKSGGRCPAASNLGGGERFSNAVEVVENVIGLDVRALVVFRRRFP